MDEGKKGVRSGRALTTLLTLQLFRLIGAVQVQNVVFRVGCVCLNVIFTSKEAYTYQHRRFSVFKRTNFLG